MEDREKFIEDKIKVFYNSLLGNQQKVYEIFKDFFGEDLVDINGVTTFKKFEALFHLKSIGAYITKEDDIGVSFSSDLWNQNCDNTIDEIPDALLEAVLNCLDNRATKRYFKNALDHVCTIIVHFPKVRVTNENDKFTDIKHLWAKVAIGIDGSINGGFGLNRSHYPLNHWESDYLHSHVSGINASCLSEFQSPCLGTGPIRNTIVTLGRGFDEDIWKLFCHELNKYVHVESLSGGPYRRLENIGFRTMQVLGEKPCYQKVYSGVNFGDMPIEDFITYFINQRSLKFNYSDKSYSLGMSYTDYLIAISNAFISWYNKLFNDNILCANYDFLKKKHIIEECIIADNRVYIKKERSRYDYYREASEYNGKEMFTFKGKTIRLEIEENATNNENKSVIVNHEFAAVVLSRILTVLNFKYGRENYSNGKEVYYL